MQCLDLVGGGEGTGKSVWAVAINYHGLCLSVGTSCFNGENLRNGVFSTLCFHFIFILFSSQYYSIRALRKNLNGMLTIKVSMGKLGWIGFLKKKL